MKLDKKLLDQLTSLSLLNLSDKEKKEFLPELQDVLDAFSKLKEIDTKKVEPAFLPIKITNKPRKDIVKECLSQEEALKNTKHKEKGYFKGPKAF